MGRTKKSYANKLKTTLRKKLNEDWDSVFFESIYYQDIFQRHQDKTWKKMRNRDLDWIRLRKLMLFGFSDAAGYERKAEKLNSPYQQVQERIMRKLQMTYEALGDQSLPIVLVAQSLGGHVISNYVWDAQQTEASRGIWTQRYIENNAQTMSATQISRGKDQFLRLQTLKFFYTTGCNIPIFVSGLDPEMIEPIKTSDDGYSINWKNFYDEDDPLGWPLQPLGEKYENAIQADYEVNVGGLLSHWNPLSHNYYWEDNDVLRPLVRDISSAINS